MYFRYVVENIPLYDSAEDDPFPKPACSTIRFTQESHAVGRNTLCVVRRDGEVSEIKLEATISSVRMPGKAMNPVESEKKDELELCLEDRKRIFSQTNAMISRIRSNSACRNYKIGPGPTSKKKSQLPRQKAKISSRKFASCKPVAELFASKEFQEEISKYEVRKVFLYCLVGKVILAQFLWWLFVYLFIVTWELELTDYQSNSSITFGYIFHQKKDI